MDENEDILAPDQKEIDNYQETDVFAWANNLVQYKDELNIELFLISKNYVLYRTNLGKELDKQLEPLFIDGILDYVLEGIETGLTVRGFEQAESEEGVLQRTQLSKVEKAREALNWAKYQEHELEMFNEDDHDIRRIKGVVARVTHKGLKDPFYVAKIIPRATVLSAKTDWMLRDGKFVKFDADAALRVPNDNQLLILNQDMYVFNQSRLKQLFAYDAKEASIAEKKVEEITKNFQLSLPDNLTLQHLVAGKKSTIKKLQTIEPSTVKQQELLDHAEELDIDLMTDDSGAIILMDGKDLDKFVNLLNDDYVESGLTGQRYEIIRKRPIKPPEDETL